MSDFPLLKNLIDNPVSIPIYYYRCHPINQSTHGRGPGQYTSCVVSDGEHGVVIRCPDVDDGQLLFVSCYIETATSPDGLGELITGYQITRVGWDRRPEGNHYGNIHDIHVAWHNNKAHM